MQHIMEMRTPAPEVVLAEFRAQKGIAETPAEVAVAPETIAEEPDAEAEEGAITPRSGRTLSMHTTLKMLLPKSMTGRPEVRLTQQR